MLGLQLYTTTPSLNYVGEGTQGFSCARKVLSQLSDIITPQLPLLKQTGICGENYRVGTWSWGEA